MKGLLNASEEEVAVLLQEFAKEAEKQKMAWTVYRIIAQKK